MSIKRLAASMFVFGLVLSSARADTMTFSDSATFLAHLGAQVTDDYSDPGYAINGIGNAAILTDSQMSAVIGETTYQATGFTDTNIVSDAGTPTAFYCAGCNGSFRLGFTSTSVGDSNGVFGAGFDVILADPGEYAFVTFGDLSTANYLLTGSTFFGIISTLEIMSIHVGLIDGGTTQSNFVEIDNLTIGAPAPVPEPASWLLLASVVSGLAGLLRQNKRESPPSLSFLAAEKHA